MDEPTLFKGMGQPWKQREGINFELASNLAKVMGYENLKEAARDYGVQDYPLDDQFTVLETILREKENIPAKT
jgi:hypothetical protein